MHTIAQDQQGAAVQYQTHAYSGQEHKQWRILPVSEPSFSEPEAHTQLRYATNHHIHTYTCTQ
jgi:hypothetical protein